MMLSSNPRSSRGLQRLLCFLAAAGVLAATLSVAHSQQLRGVDRDRGREMLKQIKKDIEKNYFDPNYRGIDLDTVFQQADEKVQNAQSLGQVFGIIGQTLLGFKDSHTRFSPPARAAKIRYGWQSKMVGDDCYVVAVKPGSDGEKKGLKPGDRIVNHGQYQPTRKNLWLLKYLFYSLRPVGGVRLTVQSPGQQPREVDVLSEIKQGTVVRDLTSEIGSGEFFREIEDELSRKRHYYYELGDDALIWQMSTFQITDQGIDKMMKRVAKRDSLILDLRGNGGGYVKALERLVGYFFTEDVKIADRVGRKKMKPMVAKTRGGKRVFQGKLIVLVDSESGSAAELFPRVMQLEERATVIGDQTAGAVMQSRFHSHTLGAQSKVLYGVSVTNADVIMKDGKSLEHVGVTPDERRLPTQEDLAAGRDPVLSYAAELVGYELSPEKAGGLFPIEWAE